MKYLASVLVFIILMATFIVPAGAFNWPWVKKIESVPGQAEWVTHQDILESGLQFESLTTCFSEIGIEMTSDDNQAFSAFSQIIKDPYCCSVVDRSSQKMIDCLEEKYRRINNLLSWLQSIAGDIASARNAMCDQMQQGLSTPLCTIPTIGESDTNQDKVLKLGNAILCRLALASQIYFSKIPQETNQARACTADARQCYHASINYDLTVRGMIENKRDCLGQWLSNIVNLVVAPPPVPGCTPQSSLPAACTLNSPLPPAPSFQQQCF